MTEQASKAQSIAHVGDGSTWFEAVADSPWSMLLDSGRAGGFGRYDIVVAEPRLTLVTAAGVTEIRERSGEVRFTDAPPLEALRRALGTVRSSPNRLPFSGGAVGYFAYDLGRRLEGLEGDDPSVPLMAVGIYDGALVVDRLEGRTWWAGEGRPEPFGDDGPRARTVKRTPLAAAGAIGPTWSRAEYEQAFLRVQRYIRDGDCYQVNLAQRFQVGVDGDPWEGYRRLRAFGAGPFSAYLNLPGMQVMSISPERFLRVRGGEVETRPIKGTRPRDVDPVADQRLAQELAASAKDRAENLMIVDLLRNDLGKCCRPGSIKVPELFSVESFPTVHHLVSTVTGMLRDGTGAIDLLRACLPGGSITGAPKHRAMEIIDELEPHRRGVYCGAIGYIGFDGAMDTNIAIRTLLHQQGELEFWAGGGIVADSESASEYEETYHKAAAMFRLLERG